MSFAIECLETSLCFPLFAFDILFNPASSLFYFVFAEPNLISCLNN
jgi:hypothetical protein